MQQQHMTRTAKLKLMKDKAKELDELRRIKDLSAQLDQHFIRVANDTHELAEGNLGNKKNELENYIYAFFS
jgi:hypothetical protein